MGSRGGEQEQLFYSFSLEDHVPKVSELCGQLAPFYSYTRRPSIDPVLMVRMLVIGYSFGIRSSRTSRWGTNPIEILATFSHSLAKPRLDPQYRPLSAASRFRPLRRAPAPAVLVPPRTPTPRLAAAGATAPV